jgi:hypothetical protein
VCHLLINYFHYTVVYNIPTLIRCQKEERKKNDMTFCGWKEKKNVRNEFLKQHLEKKNLHLKKIYIYHFVDILLSVI